MYLGTENKAQLKPEQKNHDLNGNYGKYINLCLYLTTKLKKSCFEFVLKWAIDMIEKYKYVIEVLRNQTTEYARF